MRETRPPDLLQNPSPGRDLYLIYLISPASNISCGVIALVVPVVGLGVGVFLGGGLIVVVEFLFWFLRLGQCLVGCDFEISFFVCDCCSSLCGCHAGAMARYRHSEFLTIVLILFIVVCSCINSY